MILEFSVENYRSFREKQTFSMIPDESKTEFSENVFSVDDKYSVLKSAVVYGANASGKSNLMKAFQALRNLVMTSADTDPEQDFHDHEPFAFNNRMVYAPTSFELDFLLEGTRFSYLVVIKTDTVVKESLVFYPQGREARLFQRTGQQFEFGEALKGQKAAVADLTAENQLYLSKAAKNNIKQLVDVYLFFSKSYMSIPFLENWIDEYYVDRIAQELVRTKENSVFIHNFKALLQSFDTGFVDFKIDKRHNSFEDEYDHEIWVKHRVFDDDGQEVGTTLHSIYQESTGTQKLFILGGLILRALMNGRIIMIDEFERSLHPLISSYIISMFHNPKINTKGAQLIIATHDTNLLSNNDLRRDQIWVVEKDKTGASELFSVADVKGILKEAPYEKWYLSGRFGGVPGIESLNFELNFKHEKEQRETASI